MAFAGALRFDDIVLSTFHPWFVGGWWFVAAFGALVASMALMAARERRVTIQRGPLVDPGDLDVYELAMLTVDGELAAVRLAVVNLLDQGIVQPGARWGPRPHFGAARFSPVVARQIDRGAHPLEREVVDALPGLAPKTAEQLLRLLALCDTVELMRAKLEAAGLVYGKQRWLLSDLVRITFFFLPWIAFVGWVATAGDGQTLSLGELVVNLLAACLMSYLVFAVPQTRGAAPLAAVALQCARYDDEQPDRPDNDPAQVLLHAYDTRFVGL
jgi:uncharacterized protein (TIGR04222 family)